MASQMFRDARENPLVVLEWDNATVVEFIESFFNNKHYSHAIAASGINGKGLLYMTNEGWLNIGIANMSNRHALEGWCRKVLTAQDAMGMDTSRHGSLRSIDKGINTGNSLRNDRRWSITHTNNRPIHPDALPVTYDRVFRPKLVAHQYQLRGKAFLERFYKVQHAIYNKNMRTIRGWFKCGFLGESLEEFSCRNLRMNRDNANEILDFIRANIKSIYALHFDSLDLQWEPEDIYLKVLEWRHYKRRQVNRIEGSNTSHACNKIAILEATSKSRTSHDHSSQPSSNDFTYLGEQSISHDLMRRRHYATPKICSICGRDGAPWHAVLLGSTCPIPMQVIAWRYSMQLHRSNEYIESPLLDKDLVPFGIGRFVKASHSCHFEIWEVEIANLDYIPRNQYGEVFIPGEDKKVVDDLHKGDMISIPSIYVKREQCKVEENMVESRVDKIVSQGVNGGPNSPNLAFGDNLGYSCNMRMGSQSFSQFMEYAANVGDAHKLSDGGWERNYTKMNVSDKSSNGPSINETIYSSETNADLEQQQSGPLQMKMDQLGLSFPYMTNPTIDSNGVSVEIVNGECDGVEQIMNPLLKNVMESGQIINGECDGVEKSMDPMLKNNKESVQCTKNVHPTRACQFSNVGMGEDDTIFEEEVGLPLSSPMHNSPLQSSSTIKEDVYKPILDFDEVLEQRNTHPIIEPQPCYNEVKYSEVSSSEEDMVSTLKSQSKNQKKFVNINLMMDLSKEKKTKGKKTQSLSKKRKVLYERQNESLYTTKDIIDETFTSRSSRKIKKPSRFNDHISNKENIMEVRKKSDSPTMKELKTSKTIMTQQLDKVVFVDMEVQEMELIALEAMALHDVDEMYGQLWNTIRPLKGSNLVYFEKCSNKCEASYLLRCYVTWAMNGGVEKYKSRF